MNEELKKVFFFFIFYLIVIKRIIIRNFRTSIFLRIIKARIIRDNREVIRSDILIII